MYFFYIQQKLNYIQYKHLEILICKIIKKRLSVMKSKTITAYDSFTIKIIKCNFVKTSCYTLYT